MFCCKSKLKRTNMTCLLGLFVVALSLTSLSLASNDIVLFTDVQSFKLQAKYEKITVSKTLKLQFYEDCLNGNCTKNPESSQNYLRYFSESEKQECMNYEQVAQSMNDVLHFCVDINNSTWFGGPETQYQYWPLNKFNWTDKSYVTKELDSQATVESYFFNSDGFYIHIDDSVALFVDINGGRPGYMCFAAKVTGPYRKNRNVMKFRTCKYSNPREAHENAIRDVFGMPMSIPDPYMVKYPIWSTWARYKVDVNTSVVERYAQEIMNYGFSRGTLEIDDNWETCYGSAEFNTLKFGNIRELTNKLKSVGFKTSLWTHPFINLDCYKHNIPNSKGYFVNSTKKTVNSTWWNGQASYIDFTNPEAATWWSNELHELLGKTGIDTLKFDAGESSWNPQLPEFYDQDLTYYPDNIVNAYIQTLMSFGDGIEYRSSRRSQKFGRFLRMIDRESRWDFQLGLPTLITSLIHLNMVGYPFVLPDMVGGNGYNNTPPSKEMYIRWMQANTFMPAVQFSYTPWDYDQETIDVCRYFMDLRGNYTDIIIQLMRNSVAKGSPVNPPVWWIDPTDPVAHSIDDEFLLGENILVAPVISKNTVSRDVYLPAGLWRDENHPNSPLISGRTWLKKYPANLKILPWFTNVGANQIHTSSDSCNNFNIQSKYLLFIVVVLFLL